MSNQFVAAVIDVLRQRDLDRAITRALELLVDVSGAQLARVELRDSGEVAYAREYRSLYAGHAAFFSSRKLQHDIGAPTLGTLVLVGPTDAEAVRELVALFALVLGTQADRFIRLVRGRSPLMLHEAARRFERRYATEALHQQRGNMAATARALGIARSTLYELLEDLDVSPSVRRRRHSPLRSGSKS